MNAADEIAHDLRGWWLAFRRVGFGRVTSTVFCAAMLVAR